MTLVLVVVTRPESSTSQSGWLDIFKSAAFYDPERIERDKEMLRRHYLKNGFPDVRVRAAEAIKNADSKNELRLRIKLEGKREHKELDNSSLAILEEEHQGRI